MAELKLIIVPDDDDPDAAGVFVDGHIGGRPYRFLLDTGAARTHVIFDDYTATLSAHAKDESSGVFAKSSDDLIVVPELSVGPISRQDFEVVRLPEGAPERDSLIGMDLLKDFCCHFRFDEARVEIDSQDSFAGTAFHTLRLDQRFHPYIDVQPGRAMANAVWDTGASLTVVDANFIAQHPDSFEPAGQSTGTDSTGFQMETPMFRMAPAVIGGRSFPAQRVASVDLGRVNATLDLPMDLILGYNTLSKAQWCFDFPRQRWAITQWLGAD